MNESNLIPNSERTAERRQEIARAGGIASGKARREKKSIADALRSILDEQANDTGVTRREAIVARVVKRLYERGDVYQLKALADILGESEQTLNIKGVAPIVAKDAQDAAEIADLLEQVRKRKEGEQD